MKNRKMRILLLSSTCLGAAGVWLPAAAQDDAELRMPEIIVTSRFRTESLQEVPDAVTAFSADRIEALGITDLEGFVNQTPNFFVREAFRAGVTFITIRGITTGQQGFPPITYVVDGVKAATLDSINQGALFDIERIEVLKGPQGALYGAGAIAGAVNVVTKQPTDQFEGQATASYGKGNDVTLKGAVSGPVVPEVLAFRLTGYYRNTDGLVNTTTGDDLDFEEHGTIRGRLLFTPHDVLSIDLRAAYTDIDAGAATQERFDSLDQLNVFNSATQARRGILGSENREFVDLSAKIDVNLPFATFTSVTGYLDLDQDLFGSTSFERPPGLGEPPLAGTFGPILGANAGPGEAVDNFQSLFDTFEVFTQDVRLTSTGDGPIRWVVGFEYIQRDAVQGLNVGIVLGPADDTSLFPIVDRADDKEDEIWGIYGQINWDITDRLELTLAGRYDEDAYTSRQFDPATGATIDQIDPDTGLPTIPILRAKDSDFQPKVQLSYDWTDELMTYLTFAEGFRFGFFNTGNLTAPEDTKNYELGFKSQLLDRRLTLNAAVFYIDYSNQQQTSAIPEPPFRITSNIPSTDIFGGELEFNLIATDKIAFNGSVGFLDAEIDGGGRPNAVPEWTANIGAQYSHPVTDWLELVGRVDWRYQGGHLNTDLFTGTVFEIDAVNLVNLRLSLEAEQWAIRGFVENLADEQFAIDPAEFGAFFIRDFNEPRSYGVEVSYRF